MKPRLLPKQSKNQLPNQKRTRYDICQAGFFMPVRNTQNRTPAVTKPKNLIRLLGYQVVSDLLEPKRHHANSHHSECLA